MIRHIDDARDKGADIVVGGDADSGEGLFFQPTVVVGAHHDMQLMTEETFGPVTAIMRVRDEEEAIRLSNDCKYGLSGTVFTKDADKARRIAARLTTGSVVHNDAAVIYGVPEAPFGGRKDSGLGQVNGVGALRGFTHAQPVLVDRWGRSGKISGTPTRRRRSRPLSPPSRSSSATTSSAASCASRLPPATPPGNRPRTQRDPRTRQPHFPT